MEEESENIMSVCSECVEERTDRIKAELKKQEIEIRQGDFVKVAFEKGGNKEHMWVNVTKVKGNKIIGTLSNTPCLVENVALGDIVEVTDETIGGFIRGKEIILR